MYKFVMRYELRFVSVCFLRQIYLVLLYFVVVSYSFHRQGAHCWYYYNSPDNLPDDAFPGGLAQPLESI